MISLLPKTLPLFRQDKLCFVFAAGEFLMALNLRDSLTCDLNLLDILAQDKKTP